MNCGLCLKKCAFQSGYKTRKEFEPFYGYRARHKSEDGYMKSWSGGAFVALSDWVLEHNGSVFGAGYDEKEKFYLVVPDVRSVKVKSFAPRQIQRRLFAALVTLSRKVFRPWHKWF